MAEELNSAYATLDSIVNSVIADLGEDSTHNYDKYLHWGIEGLQDFHMDSAQEVKTVKLAMNDYNAINWPSDYVDWTKIGIQVGDKVRTFGVNSDIALSVDTDDCGNPRLLSAADCNSLPDNCDGFGGYWFNNYVNDHGEILGRFFGIGGAGGGIGKYKIIKERKQIQFDSVVNRTTVYMEYIGTGFNPCEATVVNQYAKKLIKLYIHWHRCKFKLGRSTAETREAKLEYDVEHERVRSRLSDLTPEGIIELTRKNYKLSIKN